MFTESLLCDQPVPEAAAPITATAGPGPSPGPSPGPRPGPSPGPQARTPTCTQNQGPTWGRQGCSRQQGPPVPPCTRRAGPELQPGGNSPLEPTGTGRGPPRGLVSAARPPQRPHCTRGPWDLIRGRPRGPNAGTRDTRQHILVQHRPLALTPLLPHFRGQRSCWQRAASSSAHFRGVTSRQLTERVRRDCRPEGAAVSVVTPRWQGPRGRCSRPGAGVSSLPLEATARAPASAAGGGALHGGPRPGPHSPPGARG